MPFAFVLFAFSDERQAETPQNAGTLNGIICRDAEGLAVETLGGAIVAPVPFQFTTLIKTNGYVITIAQEA